jgi:hypothetical protein
VSDDSEEEEKSTPHMDLRKCFPHLDFTKKKDRQRYKDIRDCTRTIVADIIDTKRKAFSQYSRPIQGACMARVARDITELASINYILSNS